jgi:hypothetical protein
MVYVAVFLDTSSGCTWLTSMASSSGLELAAAVQRYQQHVISHARALPDHVCSMRMLDVSFTMPQGMPLVVSSCVTGGFDQPLVFRTRIREDQSSGTVLNPVEMAARSLLYKANLFLVLEDLSPQLLCPMLFAANFARNVLPSMTPRPGPSPHQLWNQDMPTLDNVLASPGSLVSFFLAEAPGSPRGHGIFVCPAEKAFQVYDIESRSLAYVPEIFLDVSPFGVAVTRSSPLTSALFGYASRFMAPLVGSPRLAGDDLGLFLDSWTLARGDSPATATAADPPHMSPGGVARQPRACAAAAVHRSGVDPPLPAAVPCGYPLAGGRGPAHVEVPPCELGTTLRAAAASWAGGGRAPFDSWESLPATVVADDGAETVN